MDNNIKDNIKKIAKETEVKLTGYLLKWKDRADGKEISDPEDIDKKSRAIADKANEIFKRRGKTILKEIKSACFKKSGEGDDEH